MGNVVAEELVSAEELEELLRLDASEAGPEDEEDDEEDGEDDGEELEPEDMPHP